MSGLSPAEVVAILRREGYTDDEVLEYFTRSVNGVGRPAVKVHPDDTLEWVLGDGTTLHQERVLREWLERQRGLGPTEYAQGMIPKIRDAYCTLARTARRRVPSIAATARKAGVDRETIPEWVRRGWMTWPPECAPTGPKTRS